MNPCQNCGKLNSPETKFCRFCGTKFLIVQHQPSNDSPYDYASPRPYAWKTDEYQTQNEARQTLPTESIKPQTERFNGVDHEQHAAPLAFHQPQHLNQPYHCPVCMSPFLPQMQKKISTAGWVTFGVLLVFFFPLFWIGLLIKEDVRVCPSCKSTVG